MKGAANIYKEWTLRRVLLYGGGITMGRAFEKKYFQHKLADRIGIIIPIIQTLVEKSFHAK